MKPNPMNYKNIKGINNGILHNSTVITCNLFNNNRLQVTCFDFAHLQKADFLTQQNDYLEKDDKENKVWFAFNDNKDTDLVLLEVSNLGARRKGSNHCDHNFKLCLSKPYLLCIEDEYNQDNKTPRAKKNCPS